MTRWQMGLLDGSTDGGVDARAAMAERPSIPARGQSEYTASITSQVTGRIGGRPILLDVARADQSLTISGQFGARAIALHLNVRALGGDIGPCRYALEFRRDKYLGQVGCGGEPAAVQLRVPAALVARGDVELAAMLTTFMAR